MRGGLVHGRVSCSDGGVLRRGAGLFGAARHGVPGGPTCSDGRGLVSCVSPWTGRRRVPQLPTISANGVPAPSFLRCRRRGPLSHWPAAGERSREKSS
jgi:hypothetical protein